MLETNVLIDKFFKKHFTENVNWSLLNQINQIFRNKENKTVLIEIH